MKFDYWPLTFVGRRSCDTGLPRCMPSQTHVTASGAGDDAGGAATTSSVTPAGVAIHSRYADNTRLSPIVRKFAGVLQAQLALANTAQASGDMQTLARFGHWLAGTAGTVGYDVFTLPGRTLQALAISGDVQATATALTQLCDMAGLLVVPEAPKAL